MNDNERKEYDEAMEVMSDLVQGLVEALTKLAEMLPEDKQEEAKSTIVDPLLRKWLETGITVMQKVVKELTPASA